jgi:hypothetical protein
MADWGSIWKGVKKIAGAVDTVMNFGGGTPGAGPAPSLIGQKPRLSFERGRIGIGEGSGLMAGTGGIGIDVPSRYGSKNQWIDLQARYLTYLNMAEAFEEPGKVRRAVKLKVT